MCKKSSGGYRDRLGYNWLWTATCGEQGVSTESGLVQISNQGWSLEARQCPDFFSFFGFGGSSVCDGVKDLISNGKAVDL
jgi:hypothetical protein